MGVRESSGGRKCCRKRRHVFVCGCHFRQCDLYIGTFTRLCAGNFWSHQLLYNGFEDQAKDLRTARSYEHQRAFCLTLIITEISFMTPAYISSFMPSRLRAMHNCLCTHLRKGVQCSILNTESMDDGCFSGFPRPLKQPPILQTRTILHFDRPAPALAKFPFLQS